MDNKDYAQSALEKLLAKAKSLKIICIKYTIIAICMFSSAFANAQPSTQIVRLAKLVIDSTQLESYKALLKEGIEASVKLEEGVLTLYAVFEINKPNHLTILEIYADKSAYQKHLETPHFKKYKEGTKSMVQALELVETVPLISEMKIKNEPDSYGTALEKHRAEYIKDLLAPPTPLIKAEDTTKIKFFPADIRYKISADFVLTPNEKTIELATSSGKKKTYQKYGVASFLWANKKVQIAVYQPLALISNPLYKDYLFIPFKDLTTGETTYGAGRYIDCRLSDIKDGKINIDFNKCYNPYCAYSDGYNCPIPPAENELNIAIEAGIKSFDNH